MQINKLIEVTMGCRNGWTFENEKSSYTPGNGHSKRYNVSLFISNKAFTCANSNH